MDFSKGEEDLMEAQVKAIKEAGANMVVTGGKVADMALHYANKYNLMLVRWVLEILWCLSELLVYCFRKNSILLNMGQRSFSNSIAGVDTKKNDDE